MINNPAVQSSWKGENELAEKIVAITAEDIRQTGKWSYVFMFNSDAPRKLITWPEGGGRPYGFVTLKDRGENEVDPFRLVRGEPGAVGPNGTLRWHVHLGKDGEQVFYASVDEDSPKEEGLQGLLKDMPSSIILIAKALFPRFELACEFAGVKLLVHHYAGELKTG